MTKSAAPPVLTDWAGPSVAYQTDDGDGPVMGRNVRRVEDDHLLRGQGTYVANLDLDGALVAHFVTSIQAHARIRSIDTAEAAAHPDVAMVLTGFDEDLGTLPGIPDSTPQPVLAMAKVRFVGEPVAVVVATTREAAVDAAELVVVDYEPLDPVVDPETAADNPSLLFEDLGTNVIVTDTGPGDNQPIDFSRFDVVAQATFVNQRLAPCPIETRVAASTWTDDGRLVHYASCQGAHVIQKSLAAYYDMEERDVRVITSDVGGSFGAKGRTYPEDVLLPHLARITGRPVRWLPDRSTDMTGLGHSRAQRQRVTIGGDADGTLRAISVDLIADLGAYARTNGGLARNTGMILPGPYSIDEIHWSLSAVVTNTTPLTAYRGAGRPEAAAVLDRAVDLFAAEAGLEPAAVRRANLKAAADLPWTNPTGLTYDSGDYAQAFETVAAAVGYDELKAEQARRRADGTGSHLGIGFSVFIDRTAGVPNPEYGSLELRSDGSFRVLTGSSPYGQGHYTTWAMLVAERTGVSVDQIEVFHGDTDVVPRGGVTGGSRSAQRAGSAVAEATDELVTQARSVAADLLEAAIEDIVLDVESARFHVAGAPGAAAVGWAQIAGHFDAPDADHVMKCETDYIGLGATVPFGAYAAVVEVDAETGAVQLQRIVTLDDAGTVINPMIVFGQIHGSLAQGIGQALFEEFAYDDDGNPVTANFLDYAVPAATEMPSFECMVSQTASPNNLLGAKGIAESGTIGAVPAVQNAVVDALAHLGVRHIDLPATPERVWRTLAEAANGAG